MLRVAERLATARKLPVIFTGDLARLPARPWKTCCYQRGRLLPVLRPLIGLDKEEIVNTARRIESYPISIRPFDDCCTLFIPRHPVTRPSAEALRRAEKKLPLEELIASCLDNIETKQIGALR